MQGIRIVRAAVWVCAVVFVVSSTVMAGQLVSTMRNVSAVMSSNGYQLQPVAEMSGMRRPGDVGFSQAFELIRPNGEAVTLGRLNTSCVCVVISAEKQSYARNERIIITLHNVKPTPPAGQMYAMYVQMSRPVRVTLRYDTFVKSGFDTAPGMVQGGTALTLEPSAPARTEPAARQEVQTSSTSNPLTVVGNNGMELIIPRWQSEEAKETEDTAKEKATGSVDSGITYSKQLAIESEPPADKAEEKAEPVMQSPEYGKEIKAESASEDMAGETREPAE